MTTTTTTLVHRPYNGPSQWWREGLVYEVISPEVTADDLRGALDDLAHVSSLGFQTLLVRPAWVDPDAEKDVEALRAFIARAHERGLRVITRVSGALGPVTGRSAREPNPVVMGRESLGPGLLRRAEAFLEAGSDGVDLGTIVPPQVTGRTDLERISGYVSAIQALLVEYAPEGILGADVSAGYPQNLRHHLQDDWFHHLRDDSFMLVRWDAGSITRHISRSLREHDRFGAPPMWRVLPSYALGPETDPGDGRRWFAVEAHARVRRALALQTLMLSLPGVVYVRQGDEVCLGEEVRDLRPTDLARVIAQTLVGQTYQFCSPLETIRYAASLRRERGLANAPLAFVTGVGWCPPGVLTFLVRDVLVLVNTTQEAVVLPAGAKVLLSSHMLDRSDGILRVPPTTTVWLRSSTVR